MLFRGLGPLGTQPCWALVRCFVPRVARSMRGYGASTPLGQRFGCTEIAQEKVGDDSAALIADAVSHGTANSRHRHARFCVEIIGRSMRSFRSHIATARRNGCARQLLALLHQPPRQQGSESLFEPDIERLNDFPANVRGVTQPREFIRLERHTRGREKEIPQRRHLGIAVHGALLLRNGVRYHSINVSQELWGLRALWKPVGKTGALLPAPFTANYLPSADTALREGGSRIRRIRACSGCAGDYVRIRTRPRGPKTPARKRMAKIPCRRKTFQRVAAERQEGRKKDAEDERESAETNRWAQSARSVARRNAECRGMRHVADAAGTLAVDQLRRSQYIGATAASAETTLRRVRHRQASQEIRRSQSSRGAWRGVGIPLGLPVARANATEWARANNCYKVRCRRRVLPRPAERRSLGAGSFSATRPPESFTSYGRKVTWGEAMGTKPELAFDVCWEGIAARKC
jgi:hypothetical protein